MPLDSRPGHAPSPPAAGRKGSVPCVCTRQRQAGREPRLGEVSERGCRDSGNSRSGEGKGEGSRESASEPRGLVRAVLPFCSKSSHAPRVSGIALLNRRAKPDVAVPALGVPSPACSPVDQPSTSSLPPRWAQMGLSASHLNGRVARSASGPRPRAPLNNFLFHLMSKTLE